MNTSGLASCRAPINNFPRDASHNPKGQMIPQIPPLMSVQLNHPQQESPVTMINSHRQIGFPNIPVVSQMFPQNPQTVSRPSLVITNSSYKDEQQRLSGIHCKNGIRLGLPTNITWEELIHEKAFDATYQRNLYRYTRKLNREYKEQRRGKVRPLPYANNKNTSNSPSANSIAVTSKTNKVSETGTTSTKSEEKLSETSVKKNVVADKLETRNVSVSGRLELNRENTDVTKIVEGIQTSKPSKSKKKENTGLLNKDVDDGLVNTDSNAIPMSSDNSDSEKKVLRRLLSESWQSIDDEIEENNSREIFERLNTKLLNFNLENKPSTSISANESKTKKKNKNSGKSIKDVETEETPKCDIPSNIQAQEENIPFDEYYDQETTERGIKEGTMFKEILRINIKNTKEAYISCSVENKDIFINGIKDRNRALNGDEVVVELYSEDKWKCCPDQTFQKCGKVVAITQKNHPRTAVGYLKVIYGKSSGIILWPRDNRLPRIRVADSTCPPKFRSQHKRFKSVLYVAMITSWETVKSAEGVVLRSLGDENSLEAESESIMLENNLDVEPFKGEEELLSNLDNTITESELKSRHDLRNECIFTIDPPTAKDLDDALSWKDLPNGNVEVGVHIADVTHYLLADTPLDKDVSSRATSVYLVDKVYNMLPWKLCETCSLLPGEDKLAFSVFIELNASADVVAHRFCKSVLRSCAQLSYEQAQEVIDKRNESVNVDLFPQIGNGYSVQDCTNVIWELYTLSVKMRKRRFSEGALKIDQPKIIFKLNESRLPVSYTLYEGKECNWLVEEFMLLANILAANKIREAFPYSSLLRCHAAPKEKSLLAVVEYLEKVGIHIDTSSAGHIYRSMMAYDCSDEIGTARMAVITHLMVRPMKRASYTCSTSNIDNCSELWHYALNTPYYTHFTSPIRRYADIVVHRLLASAINFSETPKWTSVDIQTIASNCNTKNNAAKKASEMSTELFLKLYMEKNGARKDRAVVIDVREKFFDVIDLSTRSVGRVFVDKIVDTESVDFSSGNGVPTLKIKWKGSDSLLYIQIFLIVDVEVSYKKATDKYQNGLHYTLIR